MVNISATAPAQATTSQQNTGTRVMTGTYVYQSCPYLHSNFPSTDSRYPSKPACPYGYTNYNVSNFGTQTNRAKCDIKGNTCTYFGLKTVGNSFTGGYATGANSFGLSASFPRAASGYNSLIGGGTYGYGCELRYSPTYPINETYTYYTTIYCPYSPVVGSPVLTYCML